MCSCSYVKPFRERVQRATENFVCAATIMRPFLQWSVQRHCGNIAAKKKMGRYALGILDYVCSMHVIRIENMHIG